MTAADIKLAHSSGSGQRVEIIRSIEDMSDGEEEGGERELVRVRGMSVRRLDSRRSPRSRRRVRSEAVRKSIKSDWDTPPEWDRDPDQAENMEPPPPLPPKNLALKYTRSCDNTPPLPPKSLKNQDLNLSRKQTLKGVKSNWQPPAEWEVASVDFSPSPEDWDNPIPPSKPTRPPTEQRPSLPPKARDQMPPKARDQLPPKARDQLPPKARDEFPPDLPPKSGHGPSLPPKQSGRANLQTQMDVIPPELPPKLISRDQERPPALPPKSRYTDV